MSTFGAMFRQATKIPDMKTRLPLLAAVAVFVLAAGCSTVDSRIASNRRAFDTWPPSVREKVAAGRIDLGFTTDQVRVALGEPDRIWSRTTADGTSQVWSYRQPSSRVYLGLGLGVGSFGRRGGTFGSIGIGTSTGYRDGENLGVVFDRNGVVTALESRGR